MTWQVLKGAGAVLRGGADLRGSSHSGGCESFGAAAQQVLKWRIVNGPPEQQRTVNNWQAVEAGASPGRGEWLSEAREQRESRIINFRLL